MFTGTDGAIDPRVCAYVVITHAYAVVTDEACRNLCRRWAGLID